MKDVMYETIYHTELYHWWYRVRRQIIHDIFLRYVTKKRDAKILDVGCGAGALLGELGVYGEAFGVDFSSSAVHFCKERGLKNVQEGSILKIPFPDETFDVVLALDILEHIEDDTMAIKEIRRVLKPGGIFIFFVPAFQFLWGETDVLGEHKRRYRKQELLEKIREVGGLSILRSSYFNTFLFPLIVVARFFAKIFHLGQKLESHPGQGFMNKVLYFIFHIESIFLRRMNFPFGVSLFVVGKKK